jgi:hypothetical protein
LRLEKGESSYRLTPEVMASVSSDALILHPLPRGPELPADFDADPRVACFRQAQNGLYVRMALLSLLGQSPRPIQGVAPHARLGATRAETSQTGIQPTVNQPELP